MNKHGFTLIELVVVIAVMAIVMTLSVAEFKSHQIKQRVNGQANALQFLIELAKSEAIKRRQVVTICKSNDGQSCGGIWSDGLLVFVDDDGDGTKDASEEIIDTATIDDQITLTWLAFGSNKYLRLTPRGMTLSQNGTFTLCPVDGSQALAVTVVVNKLARVRIPDVGKDANGKPISCD